MYVCAFLFMYVYTYMFVCTCGCLACIYNYLYILVAYYSILYLFGEIRTSAQAAGERRFQALLASARPPDCSQVFPRTLATVLCSPTAESGATATVTMTRPVTTRFPDVSVSLPLLHFDFISKICSVHLISSPDLVHWGSLFCWLILIFTRSVAITCRATPLAEPCPLVAVPNREQPSQP